MADRIITVAGFTMMAVSMAFIAWQNYRLGLLIEQVGLLIIRTH